LAPFLSGCNILVCLLPLTPETRNILDRRLFNLLPEDAALIQCGRGEHLVEADLREALDSGRLRGALMDVFSTEPLPPDHWMWSHDRVLVTPHVASQIDFSTMMAQAADNVRRLRNGEALHNVVQRL